MFAGTILQPLKVLKKLRNFHQNVNSLVITSLRRNVKWVYVDKQEVREVCHRLLLFHCKFIFWCDTDRVENTASSSSSIVSYVFSAGTFTEPFPSNGRLRHHHFGFLGLRTHVFFLISLLLIFQNKESRLKWHPFRTCMKTETIMLKYISHSILNAWKSIIRWTLLRFSEFPLGLPTRRPNTVKPVLNGISVVLQNIFPLKPGFRLIKIYCDSRGTWKYFRLRQNSV
jgi:hypothetical protein